MRSRELGARNWKRQERFGVVGEAGPFQRTRSPACRNREGETMLYWTVVFLIIAIIAAIFGFGGIAGTAAWIAEVLFVIFIILFLISLIFHTRRRV